MAESARSTDPRRGPEGEGQHTDTGAVRTAPAPAYSGTHSASTAGDVLDELGEIRADIAALSYALAREHERASFREEIIDRLHNENQQLRRSEQEATLEPVRAGLYHLYDMAHREADRWRMAGESGQAPAGPLPSGRRAPSDAASTPLFSVFSEQVASLFVIFTEEVLDVLGRTGVEPYEVHVGEPFDNQLHRPVETAAVADENRDGTVVEVLSGAFVRGEQVIRRADVVVGQFDAS